MLIHWMGAVIAMVVFLGGETESVSDQIEKAVYQEKTAGDLDAAIKIYQGIIEREKASRPAIAQAYYRLGLCLAKKGTNDKAVEAFQAVVNNYADQKTLVAAAQKELTRLGPGRGPTAVERRAVGKRLAEWPQDINLSSPESAVAAYHRASARMDEKAVADLSWVKIDPAELERVWKRADPEDIKIYNQAQLDAEVVEVLTYGPDLATVVTLLKFPEGAGRHPYSDRLFGRINGQWKNLGEDRLPSLEAARENFDRKKDRLREHFEQIKTARGVGTRPADGTATRNLLDPQTRTDVELFDQMFASWFRPETAYEAAPESEKAAMVEKWILDARSNDFNTRTRAIAALGNVRAREAVHVLIEIAEEPMGNNRPKWMAVRALGRIGDPAAAPALIELVDYGNKNVQVYARAGLADMAGVYFGDDKTKWRQWWKDRGEKASDSDKLEAEKLSTKAWQAWGARRFEEAEKLFRQSAARNPRVANTWNGLGWAQFNQGRPMAAKVSFEKALAIDAGHPAALNGMGWIAKGQGAADEAIGYWKKAVEAHPDATAALAGLARTLLEQKKYNEATVYFEMWIKAEPNNEEASAGLKEARAGGK